MSNQIIIDYSKLLKNIIKDTETIIPYKDITVKNEDDLLLEAYRIFEDIVSNINFIEYSLKNTLVIDKGSFFKINEKSLFIFIESILSICYKVFNNKTDFTFVGFNIKIALGNFTKTNVVPGIAIGIIHKDKNNKIFIHYRTIISLMINP